MQCHFIGPITLLASMSASKPRCLLCLKPTVQSLIRMRQGRPQMLAGFVQGPYFLCHPLTEFIGVNLPWTWFMSQPRRTNIEWAYIAAFSLAVVLSEAWENELHLVVGTDQDTLLSPRFCTSSFLRCQCKSSPMMEQIKTGSLRWTFLNRTRVRADTAYTESDDVPLAFLALQAIWLHAWGKPWGQEQGFL